MYNGEQIAAKESLESLSQGFSCDFLNFRYLRKQTATVILIPSKPAQSKLICPFERLNGDGIFHA